jgi:hypothetical protein
VLEEPVELGACYSIEMGLESEAREVRIVWVQDEADGQIVGVEFTDRAGSVPPPSSAANPAPKRNE